MWYHDRKFLQHPISSKSNIAVCNLISGAASSFGHLCACGGFFFCLFDKTLIKAKRSKSNSVCCLFPCDSWLSEMNLSRDRPPFSLSVCHNVSSSHFRSHFHCQIARCRQQKPQQLKGSPLPATRQPNKHQSRRATIETKLHTYTFACEVSKAKRKRLPHWKRIRGD